jgi:AraC-like DNA-binding protein
MDDSFYFKFAPPIEVLSDFIESIGTFCNRSEEAKEVVLLPDGRIDLFFFQHGSEPWQVTLIGLENAPKQRAVPPQTLVFVISFRPLAVEYILHESIAPLLNSAKDLPNDFLNFHPSDFADFEVFSGVASEKIKALLPTGIDERKRELFRLIYSSNGEMTVKELSDRVFWSSRQINRYFNSQLGLSLKAYCTILRFRTSLQHIAEGKLFPELDFADQTHFIREIKKFSGVAPKELSKNKNDRFVLLSVLRQK